MDGVTEVRANVETHPEFGEALDDARKADVEVLFLTCHVEPDELVINYPQNGGSQTIEIEV